MNKQEINKLLGLSLIAYIIAGFMFAIGLMIKNSIVLFTFYIIAMLLMISSILSLYNNYKKNKNIKLFLFLVSIGIILTALLTVSMVFSL